MYTPPHFREDRLPVLQAAMRQTRLAILVSQGANGIDASHVPLMLAADQGPCGTLYGHLARANAQGRVTEAGQTALAIFPGPDAYVSPSWYPSKAETGKVVPTWNYVAVHATGLLHFFDDRDRLLALVDRLTRQHEQPRPAPWAVADAPADYIASQLRGIIGFTLVIERLEGKWKLSQNRTAADRQGVIDGLAASQDPGDAAIVALMRTAADQSG